VGLLYLPLNTIINARYLLSKEIKMSAQFGEKCGLMLKTFPRHAYGKTKVVIILHLAIHIHW
jgi:hypothetical protein